MKKKIPLYDFFDLDPRFKTFRVMSKFIGHEQGKVIVEEHD
jgi:hypothetical protein